MSKIQTNNTSLEEILETINNLPEAGGSSIIDKDKIIEKTANGSIITLDDVSEVSHEVEIVVSENCTVKAYGKNYFTVSKLSSISNANVLSILNNSSVSIAPDTNGKLYGIYALASFDIGTVIECSIETISANGFNWGWRLQYTDGTYSSMYKALFETITISKETQKIMFYVDMASTVFTEPIVLTGFRVNVIDGSEFSVPTNNGTAKVKSVSPYMTIATDTVGVDITATYHKSWGMQEQNNRFWDIIQNQGNRTQYQYAFINWDCEYLHPKYKIIPTAGHMAQMFYNNKSLRKIETEYFDFSNVPTATYASGSSLYYTFQFCSKLEEIETELPGDFLSGTFHSCSSLHTIAKINVKETTTFTANPFYNCTALKEIRFGENSVIGKSLDLHWSIKLSLESVINIFEHLGGTTSATLTLPTSHNDGRYDNLIANMPSNWAVAWL